MRSLKVVGFGVAGWIVGAIGGVVVPCCLLFPESNMCGIYGVVTCPLGLVAGLIVGLRITRAK